MPVVALQPDQRRVEHRRKRLRRLGLADARLALEQQRLRQAQAEEHRRGQALVDEVVDGREALGERLDVGHEGGSRPLRHPSRRASSRCARTSACSPRSRSRRSRRRARSRACRRRRDRHAADRVDRGGRRPDGCAAAATATIRARIESAISAGVRAPMSSPAGDVDARRAAPRRRRRRAARRVTPRRACGSRRARRSGRPASRPGRRAASSSLPVRRDDEREIAGRGRRARRPRCPARRRSRARARGRGAASASTIGVSPATSTRGAGSTGSRKISIAPPDRHGFLTVTAPSSRDELTVGRRGLVVVGQDPQQQRRRRSRSPQRVEPHAVLRADAADEALDRAVGVHERRRSRAATLAGRCTRTTVAVTNGAPSAASSCGPRARARR